MGKNKRRQSTSALSSKFDASMPEEITDDDIYAAFGITKDGSEDDLKLDTSTPRRRSKKKVKKRQSAPVKRMSIYDVLYEDEDKYEIPKGVFDVESPQANEKKLKKPKSAGKPVEIKIPNLDREPSIFDMLISPRESKEKYGKKKKKIKTKELVADLGTPILDDEEEEIPEPPSEQLPVLNDTFVSARPICMNKLRKETKKVRSKSLLIDLGEPPMAVAECPESLSASDSQLFLDDEYVKIKPGSTPRRSKKNKKVRTESLLIDLGAPPMTVSEISDSFDFVAIPEKEITLDIRSSSMTKRGKKAKKIKSKSLTMDLGNPIVEKESPGSLYASDSQLFLDDDYAEIKSGSTPKRSKKNKKVRSNSLLIDLGEPPVAVLAEIPDPYSSDFVAIPDNETTLDISPSSMTKRGKKAKKIKSKRLTMDLGNPIVKKESTELLHYADTVLPLNDESLEINLSGRTTRDGLDQEVLPRRRCRSHSPHARKSMVHWGVTELHVIEESSEESSAESDDDRWSTHSSDSPPHVPRKRRKRHKSCAPPLARSPNRLWLDSFEVSLRENDENKTKKKKKKRRSKEKSVEKPANAVKKSSEKLANEEVEKPCSMNPLNSNPSSKDNKKGNPKKRRKSIRKESNRLSTISMDSSIEDSVEKPSSRHSLDSNESSKGSRKESPKKKRKSSRKSSLKEEPSLHDSMEIAAAVVAAEEEATRAAEEARRKADIEQAKLRAEEEARRMAEQEAAAARLRLKVAEALCKVEEEDQLRAKRKAEKQAEEGAIIRAQEQTRRNAEMEEECKLLKAEQERLQQERAEIQLLRKAEQERLEKERAKLKRQKDEEAELLAKERANLERQRLEEEQRLQREMEKQERELIEEKARIKAEQHAATARLKAEKQEREQIAKAEKLRLKAEKQERDRLAKEEKARIKAQKDAELARIKAEKDAQKARIKAEKEAEKTRIKREKIERERKAEEEKVRIEAEKEAELKHREEEATDRMAEEEHPLKLKKPSMVDRNYSIDSLFQGSIDNSLHAESEAERLIRDRQQLEREMANLERQKNAAAARLQRRAEAIRAAVKAEKAKPAELDEEMHTTDEGSEEEKKESLVPRRRKEFVTKEKRERTPSPETGEEAKQRAKKEAWVRKQEKRRRMEEQAVEDYRLGKLDGRRSISKNDRQFGSGWNKVLVS